MILTVSSTQPSPNWQTRVALDFSLRRWTAQAGDRCWRQVTLSPGGALDLGSQLTLKDARNNAVLVLGGAPQHNGDAARAAGKGSIVSALETSLSGLELSWQQQALAGVDGLTDVRRAGIELCSINLPSNGVQDAPNCVEGGAREPNRKNKSGFRATGCGGLAGWYFQELLKAGFRIPEARVRKTFKWTPPSTGKEVTATEDLYLTSYTFGHREVVKGLEKNTGRQVYIDFRRGCGLLPRRGDVYFIRTPGGLTRHVGVFFDADEKGWRTADGGQGWTGFGVGIAARRFDPATGSISGGKEVGYVDGWIDLDELIRLGEPA
jgi:hypothetical protein